MPAAFRTTRMIEFSDTDMAGIVHFARFFCFMESAEHAFLRSLGLSVALEWEGESIGFPRVNATCQYLRPVRFEDTLTTVVHVAKLGRSSITYRFECLCNEQLAAQGEITAVCCRLNGGPGLEKREIPEGIRALLKQGHP